jgi:plasmid maintenance system killer protein
LRRGLILVRWALLLEQDGDARVAGPARSRAGTWAVSVSGKWRVTFTFVGKDPDAVDYEDHH